MKYMHIGSGLTHFTIKDKRSIVWAPTFKLSRKLVLVIMFKVIDMVSIYCLIPQLKDFGHFYRTREYVSKFSY